MRIPKHLATVMAVTIAAGSLSFNVANADTKSSNEQIIGKNRFETAVKISQKGWKTAESAILVNDSAIADALSATPFADAKNAPVLLTGKNNVHSSTMAELKRLGVKNVYLIGGSAVLSENVKSELEKSGMKVERIAGSTREATSVEIAEKLDSIKNVKEIAVVNGTTGLSDAVSVAAAAADKDMPIILSNPKKGTEAADKFIKDNGITKSYIIGGTKAISSTVASKLPGATRLQGDNRNDTNAKVMETFYTSRDISNVYVAKDGKGEETNIIDALSVGVLAAKNDVPVMIVDSKKLSDGQKNVINTKSFAKTTQVGGQGNEKAFSELNKIQAVTTYNVSTVAELNNALSKADANDVINMNESSARMSARAISENITISTNKAISIKLSGTYTGKITLKIANAKVINNGTIKELSVESTKNATVENTASAKIEKVTVSSTSSNVEIVNKGTVSKVENNATGTTINNQGTISSPVTGSVSPEISGNKPSDSTNNGGTSNGGGSSSGGGSVTNPSETEQTAIVENVKSAIAYEYKDDISTEGKNEAYTYTGTITSSANGNDEVSVLATGAYESIDLGYIKPDNGTDLKKKAMDDMARFLGALYRIEGSSIKAIEYNGKTYTWNTSGTLLGSNWENKGMTLVKQIVTDFRGESPINEPGKAIEMNLVGTNGAKVKMNFNFSKTGESVNMKTFLENAKSKADYAFKGTFVFTEAGANNVNVVSTGDYKSIDLGFLAGTGKEDLKKAAMDDMARFLGSIYRVDEGKTVSKIVYNGKTYTWNVNGSLKGSNWQCGEMTLVKQIVTDFRGENPIHKAGDVIEMTLLGTDGTKTKMNLDFVKSNGVNLSNAISEAVSFKYSSATGTDEYKYKGTLSAPGTDVTATGEYTSIDLASTGDDKKAAMDDMARFLGALYRKDNGASVSAIVYNGHVYRWNGNGTLKGSNWQNGDIALGDGYGKGSMTLVKQIVTNFRGDNPIHKAGDKITFTLIGTDGTTSEMTYQSVKSK